MSTMKRMWTDREVRSMADESAKIRIEAGLTENAKPIYCHPVTLADNSVGSSQSSKLGCLIFNNSPTPFTLATFIDYIDELYTKVGGTVRIITTGGFTDNNNNVAIAAYIGKVGSNSYYLSGLKNTGEGEVYMTFSKEQLLAYINYFYDGVNKIN